jgi:ferritin-like metal-binding protein YciE
MPVEKDLAKKLKTTATNGHSKKAESKKVKAKKEKKNSSEKENDLECLFKEGLKDVYSAEKQLVEAWPKIVKATVTEDLQDAFNRHLEESKRHMERLEKVFKHLEIETSEATKCKAMQGLLEEDEQVMKDFEEGSVRDSALIIGAQKRIHYKIASYGSLCELADVLREIQVRDLLDRTLQDEESMDKELTSIAVSVNDEAYESGEEDTEAPEEF